MCAGEAKSVVHAVKVGELNPQEIPKQIPDKMTVSELSGKTIKNMEAIKKKEEIINTGIRPYWSDDLAKNTRTPIDEMVNMVKYRPLLCQPIILEISGTKVTMTPYEKETKIIIQKTGIILGSKTSFQPILKSDKDMGFFLDLGKVSFILVRIKMDNKAKRDEIQNISRSPNSLAKKLPMTGPMDIPVAVKIPRPPCASPRFDSGMISAT
jgi:hypothetical protein